MRGWIIGGVATLAVAGAVTAGFVLTGGKDDDAGAAPDTTDPQQLATVEQRDLQRAESFAGTTGHGQAEPLLLAGSGTLTALPAVGDIIDQGTVVAEVDGRPIIALQGPLPMWRALGPSVTDGKDVQQLEYVLTALGYGETYGITVDEDWTSATTNAVEAFQEDHGQDDDGTIDIGDIVWIPGPVRVDSVAGAVGQQLADAGIEVTGTTQTVHVKLDVSDGDLLAVGTAVTVELPSGETIDGVVASVGTVETAEDGIVDVARRRDHVGSDHRRRRAARRRRGHHGGCRRRPRRPRRGTPRPGRWRLRPRGVRRRRGDAPGARRSRRVRRRPRRRER